MNGEWVTDMHAYYGFNNGSSEVNATEWRANQTATDTYLGGFDSTTLADECAAHLCYACFCDATFVAEKQKGSSAASAAARQSHVIRQVQQGSCASLALAASR